MRLGNYVCVCAKVSGWQRIGVLELARLVQQGEDAWIVTQKIKIDPEESEKLIKFCIEKETSHPILESPLWPATAGARGRRGKGREGAVKSLLDHPDLGFIRNRRRQLKWKGVLERKDSKSLELVLHCVSLAH